MTFFAKGVLISLITLIHKYIYIKIKLLRINPINIFKILPS